MGNSRWRLPATARKRRPARTRDVTIREARRLLIQYAWQAIGPTAPAAGHGNKRDQGCLAAGLSRRGAWQRSESLAAVLPVGHSGQSQDRDIPPGAGAGRDPASRQAA